MEKIHKWITTVIHKEALLVYCMVLMQHASAQRNSIIRQIRHYRNYYVSSTLFWNLMDCCQAKTCCITTIWYTKTASLLLMVITHLWHKNIWKGWAKTLTLILLMWRIWWAPNNASRWQRGFNLAFKGLTQFYLFLQFNDAVSN